jgi:hypothetical protein
VSRGVVGGGVRLASADRNERKEALKKNKASSFCCQVETSTRFKSTS